MTKISDLLQNASKSGEKTVSFEFFPAKTESGGKMMIINLFILYISLLLLF